MSTSNPAAALQELFGLKPAQMARLVEERPGRWERYRSGDEPATTKVIDRWLESLERQGKPVHFKVAPGNWHAAFGHPDLQREVQNRRARRVLAVGR